MFILFLSLLFHCECFSPSYPFCYIISIFCAPFSAACWLRTDCFKFVLVVLLFYCWSSVCALLLPLFSLRMNNFSASTPICGIFTFWMSARNYIKHFESHFHCGHSKFLVHSQPKRALYSNNRVQNANRDAVISPSVANFCVTFLLGNVCVWVFCEFRIIWVFEQNHSATSHLWIAVAMVCSKIFECVLIWAKRHVTCLPKQQNNNNPQSHVEINEKWVHMRLLHTQLSINRGEMFWAKGKIDSIHFHADKMPSPFGRFYWSKRKFITFSIVSVVAFIGIISIVNIINHVVRNQCDISMRKYLSKYGPRWQWESQCECDAERTRGRAKMIWRIRIINYIMP